MSRRPLGFVKERKTRKGGFKNYKVLPEGVFTKVRISLTGKRWVVFQVMPDERSPATPTEQNSFSLY
jgi:hypothetical protein